MEWEDSAISNLKEEKDHLQQEMNRMVDIMTPRSESRNESRKRKRGDRGKLQRRMETDSVRLWRNGRRQIEVQKDGKWLLDVILKRLKRKAKAAILKEDWWGMDWMDVQPGGIVWGTDVHPRGREQDATPAPPLKQNDKPGGIYWSLNDQPGGMEWMPDILAGEGLGMVGRLCQKFEKVNQGGVKIKNNDINSSFYLSY
jgi:hypothetical protein